jgi:hypothetical protein
MPASAQTVATYHGHADRSGNFTMPQFTWARARMLHLDASFAPRFAGHLYAQPLYWRPAGRASGILIVASESNVVTAIDATTGATLWNRSLGPPAPLSTFPCGNIDPLGVTGTPVIDPASGSLYLDAMVLDGSRPHHRVYALSLNDGAIKPGWPIDVADVLRTAGYRFDPGVQNQRGALLLLNGVVYIPYGGFYGDCGDYHGWVVGVPTADPQRVIAWQTRGRGGGIWAPGGIASDGRYLYVATGNNLGARQWADGEAVFRLSPDLRHTEDSTSFFAAANWRALDARDADLGGTNPLPLALQGGAQPLVLALGKDERAYLLDRRNLGGLGGSLVSRRVASHSIRTAPALYSQAGAAEVAFQGRGADCPTDQDGDLTVLRIIPGSTPAIATAWCGVMTGAGAPIVTTTDGISEPIVWILGAEGDNRLHGFRGDDGAALYTSPPVRGLRHFQTLIAADNRLFVGADGRLYAFSLSP